MPSSLAKKGAVIAALLTCATTAVTCNAAITIDLSYVNTNSPQFSRFQNWVGEALQGNPDYGFTATDAAYMFEITGQAQYCTLAIDTVQQQVDDANAAIANGQNPPVAADSYLYVGSMIGDVALTYDWCSAMLTSSQQTQWAAYANQAIYNVWNPSEATWGGRAASWSGWATSDPADNYYYSFTQATMLWTLADDSATWMDFLNTVKIPLLTSYFATIDGGSQEGTGYGLSHRTLFGNYRAWHDSTGVDLANETAHETDSIYWWLYATVPTLDKTAAIGDQSRVSEPVIYDYHRILMLEARKGAVDPDALSAASWWLNNISIQHMTSGFNYREDLLPPGSGGSPPSALTYHAEATGHLFSRTSWDTSATWFEFDAGPYVEQHAHQDQGSFTLYQGDWLSVTENIWTHSGIQQGTEVANVLRFEQNGSIVQQHVGTTSTMSDITVGAGGTVHAVGDLTPAYGNSSPVQSWQRTVDFSADGSLVVQDDYATASGTTATFQVNTPVQPVISGSTAVAGNLVVTVLEPAGATLQAIDWRTQDSDYNSGWRLDIAGGNGHYKVQLSGAPVTDEVFGSGFDSP